MITRGVDAIVVHCSATPDGAPLTVEEVDAWHKARGFRRSAHWLSRFNPRIRHCGYHRLVDHLGRVQEGRHYDEVGAHVQGSNARSIGLCMAGTGKFSHPQWFALQRLVVSIVAQIAQGREPKAAVVGVEEAIRAAQRLGVRIVGHRDFSPDRDGDGVVEPWEWVKSCPGFDVGQWVAGGMEPPVGHVL